MWYELWWDENIEPGITYEVEIDEQTGFQEKVIIESRNKKLIPTLLVKNSKGEIIRSYNLPVGAHLVVNDGDKIDLGKILVKIPRKSAKTAGYVAVGAYGSINNVDESLLKQDSESAYAVPTGSGNGWYNYEGPPTHLITPIAGRTLIFKTHNGRYAKMEIQSYYKNAPESPNAFTDEAQVYTFNYTYQPNEGVASFD